MRHSLPSIVIRRPVRELVPLDDMALDPAGEHAAVEIHSRMNYNRSVAARWRRIALVLAASHWLDVPGLMLAAGAAWPHRKMEPMRRRMNMPGEIPMQIGGKT